MQTPQANSFVCTWEQTSSLFDWDLLAFQTYFCFHSPFPPSSDAPFKKLTPKLSASHASPWVKRGSFWLAYLHWQANHMLRHWSLSVWWCKGKLMLRLWNHETKTVTVTRNLVLELKYDTVNKKLNKLITTCPVGQATEIFTCPTEYVTCPGQSGSPCHTLPCRTNIIDWALKND